MCFAIIIYCLWCNRDHLFNHLRSTFPFRQYFCSPEFCGHWNVSGFVAYWFFIEINILSFMGIPLVNLIENSAHSTTITWISNHVGLGTGLWPLWQTSLPCQYFQNFLYCASILKAFLKTVQLHCLVDSLSVQQVFFLRERRFNQMFNTSL